MNGMTTFMRMIRIIYYAAEIDEPIYFLLCKDNKITMGKFKTPEIFNMSLVHVEIQQKSGEFWYKTTIMAEHVFAKETDVKEYLANISTSIEVKP